MYGKLMAGLDVVFEEMESEDVSNMITGDIKYHELNQFFSQIRCYIYYTIMRIIIT